MMRLLTERITRVLCVYSLVLLGAGAHAPVARQAPADLLIRNVRVLHGDGRVTPVADVMVRGGIIESVRRLRAPSRDEDHAPARRVIDARGLTLIPGLVDAHVHAAPWVWPLFLKYGVTTVRDLHNDAAFIFPLAAEAQADRPRVVASGPAFDGPGGDPRVGIVVATVGEARAAVRRQVEAGARVIKISPRVEPPLFLVLASEAGARGVPVAAHLGATTAAQAADAGVASIEHLSGVVESASLDAARLVRAHADFFGGWTAAMTAWREVPIPRLEAVARDVAAKGVVMVPTLVAHEAVSRLADAGIGASPDLANVPADVRDRSWEPAGVMARAKWTPAVLAVFKQALPILQQFVSIYARVGGRIAAGSDVGQAFVVPGIALHRELEMLVQCGLSPSQAVKAATADGAALLGLQDRVGTIDAGKIADLVLLEGDPLADIRNTRRIVAVVKDGVVIEPR